TRHVCGDVCKNPSSTVNKEEGGPNPGGSRWPHDGQAHLQAVLHDRSPFDVAGWQLDRNRRLDIHKDLSRFDRRQRLHGFAAGGIERSEKLPDAVFNFRILRWISDVHSDFSSCWEYSSVSPFLP